MTQTKLVAEALFVCEPDVDGICRGWIVEHEDSLWLVANWLQAHGTAERIPAQLIPLAKLAAKPTGDPGLYRFESAVPRALLTYPIPPALASEYGVVDAPGLVHIPGPRSVQ